MKRALYLTILLSFVLGYSTPAMAESREEYSPIAGEETGLPLPRFVSLRFDEVNVRTGPGPRYPIRWVYKRKNLPMEVTEEFGQWRKVKDFEGDEGWVHKSQIAGDRTVVFLEDVTLLRYPEADAPPMVKAQKRVIAQALECKGSWCELQLDSYKAWVQKNRIWGVYSREEFE